MTETMDDLDADVMPHSIEAEQSVLGAMLISGRAIEDVIEVIRADDFYRPAHQIIYGAAVDMYREGQPLDAMLMLHALQKRGQLNKVGGAAYLHTLTATVPVAANASWYARIVRENAIRREFIVAGQRLVAYGHSHEDIDVIAQRAQTEVFAVTENRAAEDYAPLADIMPGALDELASIGQGNGGLPTGFIDLDELTGGNSPGQFIIVAGRPGMGKALALDTPLPTPDGWTTMGAVRVGDCLLGADGKPTRVVAATEVMNGRPCYEVHFSDGEIIVADGQHQWVTWDRKSRRDGSGAPRVVTTEQIAETLRAPSGSEPRANHAVQVCRPFELPHAELPVDPYILGYWLGDGDSLGSRVTVSKEDLPHLLEQIALAGYFHGVPYEEETAARVSISNQPIRLGGDWRDLDSMSTRLRKLGVLGDKHIPAAYLRASESQRRALLEGLMDTDGTVNSVVKKGATGRGAVVFYSTSKRLAEGVQELALSLGYRASIATKPVKGRSERMSTCYKVNFSPQDKVFRLPRKVSLQDPAGPARARFRYITNVCRVASVPVRCVEVDNDSHLYLAGRSCIPTHNSTLGMDWARNAAKEGHPAVIFSLEMSRLELVSRLLSAEARVNLHKIRAGKMDDEDWTRVARRLDEVGSMPLFIDDSPNMSIPEIRAKCRRLKLRHGLRLVVVDYLQLMQDDRSEGRQQEVSDISRSLKKLAKELEVPVVAMSQLNRGPEQRTDKRPQVADLRESGSLEQDADKIILLYRDDVYERESPRAGEADLIVAKHRNGPTATVTVAFQGHYSRFVDMAQRN